MGMQQEASKSEYPQDQESWIALLEERDQVIEERDQAIEERDATIEKQSLCISHLEQNLKVVSRIAFGKKSEKRPVTDEHPNQLHLFLHDLVADAERASAAHGTEGHIELKAPAKKKPAKKKGRRKKFPENAPRIETVYELPEDKRICACGECMHAIGFESKTQLERLEVTVVHKIKRQKYACRSCEEKVITTPGPIQPIKKGLLGTGFLAQLIIEHFQNHMPYHRLEHKYDREGLKISRSVMERSMAKCGEILTPLHEALKEEILQHEIVFTDDTPVRTVQKKGPKDGRLWVYLSKDGHHYYDFTTSRSGDGPKAVFGDYDGYIQADAFAGYDQLYGEDKATEVACWAHARRKFEMAEASDPALSKEALDLIRELYLIETLARDHELEAEELFALRKNRAGPLLEKIKTWLALQAARSLPSSPMGKAITYAQNQWDALNVYVEDGRLEIDNNAAERGMRPIALGRKNWMFFQSLGGGKTASVLLSLVQTAEAAGVNAKDYLRDVLVRIATEKDVKKLLPHAWKKHFEGEVTGRRNEILNLLTQGRQGE